MPVSDAQLPEDPAGTRGGGGSSRDAARPALTRSDERVLSYLADVGADYQAFIAGNTGLYDDHVESRLEALSAAGLVERVSGEAVYRVTEAGRDALRDDCPRWSD